MLQETTIVTIGHITNDLGQDEVPDHLGGGAAYSAVAAKNLGLDVHIVTKCPPDHPYVEELRHRGIHVHVLPSPLDRITTFRNNYNQWGHRQQKSPEQQEPISIADWEAFPHQAMGGASILVAPVVGEVDPQLFPMLASMGSLSVTPQGYFRKINEEGAVSQQPWAESSALGTVGLTILSDEDLGNAGRIDLAQLRTIRATKTTVVLTQGSSGATIYEPGHQPISTDCFRLQPEEGRNFTGAGDIFAAAMLVCRARGSIVRKAVTNAHLFAALKIAGPGGDGIESIPTRQHFDDFMADQAPRVRTFMTRSGVRRLNLFK
ncbi:hypothetical protein A2631_04935 [Candidatus Daviesbacteria bacterium RIFCSPHIGHO2_01_FULL_44_29]|uniref:Carbohydrate kinase PfkB domain-containing protein n=1 Tax=Candidatus Daviesbacteria bacterium RIFCSPHIGHO2_02_FULL_43_12 TaxID=1797776 RepID=A0A1F5KGL3_9BACT|nr:MAG: hypothetical protein A2631_04935 [Candidatus Daviesbacteria bacterium RIFCSPHIGHO2_01_FULL_44_29]OGE40067.1 MAG: hypothetical protein A3D25_04665 [Candidatus Daviesbacteria bacterium RIFCSPHIGHO2_02_FULL_43_12]OGE41451.1 MAG: hypothetical protein A3E86_05145 [Candidatus Daviesbacteria bacterium RIFCSPHIGHO2_12_FULL_47_45]OGE70253.1 MAG: hypothetical protein A3B55_00905 [Candidatus Daviesbacteria bacterium RIFCSPLOWO2_01_FULL_43_15]